jgi:putative addiction module component (TIGR02574 family)
MSLSPNELEAAALALPQAERVRLARRLIVSLDAEIEDDPADVERAWEEEIRRRLAEVNAGTAELIPAEQVFAELRGRSAQPPLPGD